MRVFLGDLVPGFLQPIIGGKAFRSVAISACLARQCAIAKDSLEEAAPTTAATATVTVQDVPASIPQSGIKLLDEWAQQQQQALDSGRTLQDWLPGFLSANYADVLGPAASAANYLGCQAFQDLVLQLQLLQTALRIPPSGPASSFATVVKPAPLRKFLHWWRFGGRRGYYDSGGNGVRMVMAASAGPRDGKPEVKEDQLRLLPCLQPQQPAERPEGQPTSSDAAPAAASPQGASVPIPTQAQQLASETPAANVPLLSLSRPPRRMIWLDRFDSLASELCKVAFGTCTSAQVADVRRHLYALGFIPSWRRVVQGERVQHADGKSVYASLEVGPLPPGYEVAAVEVVAESRDQGWTGGPQHYGTYNSSTSWGELQLYDSNDKLATPDRGHLFINLHAVKYWQTHDVKLGPESDLVRDLNALLVTAPAAPEAASSAAGQAGETGNGGADGGKYSLRLLMCALYRGWECHMRGGRITVELRPV